MDMIRRWIFRPKRSDGSLLAQFFYADRDLNVIAEQLEKFDGHKNVEQFTNFISQLRKSQDNVLSIIEKIMDVVIPSDRACRDFRVKFPYDILQESLAGRLWFGAECLAAGSSIINHEVESQSMQPLAKQVTEKLSQLRNLLREQSLRTTKEYTEEIRVSLMEFDALFAEFELCYVSAMVPVKSMKDYDNLQEVAVLFSETIQRSLRLGWLSQEQLDMYDPALMFTIPRLAVICGLVVYPEGPLNPDRNPSCMSEMFRPFQLLLCRIRDLLWTLSMKELWILEMLLSKGRDPAEWDLTFATFNDLDYSQCHRVDDFYTNTPERIVKDLCTERITECDCREARSKVACSSSDNHCVSLSNGLSEIGEFFEEIVRSSGFEEAHLNFDTSSNLISECCAMQHSGREDDISDAVNVLHSAAVSLENAGASKPSVANTVFCDTAQTCRSSRTDLDLLSSQVSNSNCITDCSRIHQISCGCQETNTYSEASVAFENLGFQNFPALEKHVSSGNAEPSMQPVTRERKPRDDVMKAISVNITNSSENVMFCNHLASLQNGCLRPASCPSNVACYGYDWNRESYSNIVTNSTLCYNDNDEEEAVMLAIQAAEISACQEARSHFKDSMDLIQRLFVCVSGIADQLQTNFASDIRRILKAVFDCNTSSELATNSMTSVVVIPPYNETADLSAAAGATMDVTTHMENDSSRPRWIPDDESPFCTSCQATFTFVRRRHHCRNCGKVFCGQCSSNTVPLPHYGHEKPVRVCNHCFLFCVTHFTIAS